MHSESRVVLLARDEQSEDQRIVVVDPTDTLTRDPDYVRRDEHIVHVRVEDGRGSVTGEEQESFFESLLRQLEGLAGQVAAQRQMTEALFERLDKLATYIETQTRWQPETETISDTPRFATHQGETPLDYYLAHEDVSQRDVARHFHMNPDNLRTQLQAEAAARRLLGALQERVNLSHKRASMIARDKAIEREAGRRLSKRRR